MKSYLLLIILFFSQFLFSQNFYSEYNVISSKNIILKTIPETNLKDLKSVIELFKSSDLTTISKMEIISNQRYSFIKINLIDVNFLTNDSSDVKPDLYLIDFKTGIAYNVNNQSFFECKKYTINTNRKNQDSIWNQTIIDKQDTAILTFDKKLPKIITNRLLINNNLCGINKVVTKNEIIILTKYESSIKFDLDFFVTKVIATCKKRTKAKDLLFFH